MKMVSDRLDCDKIITTIPSRISHVEILIFLRGKGLNWEYVMALKEVSRFTDTQLAQKLNISIGRLRSYKKPESKISIQIQEHILLLLLLFKQGEHVFGTFKYFVEWLEKNNFFFDKKAPMAYLTTYSGVSFIYDRLTAMEYGDNV